MSEWGKPGRGWGPRGSGVGLGGSAGSWAEGGGGVCGAPFSDGGGSVAP